MVGAFLSDPIAVPLAEVQTRGRSISKWYSHRNAGASRSGNSGTAYVDSSGRYAHHYGVVNGKGAAIAPAANLPIHIKLEPVRDHSESIKSQIRALARPQCNTIHTAFWNGWRDDGGKKRVVEGFD
eukprot:968359-Amphidinium_carterae.1